MNLTSTPHNILSKPLATFPNNHCRNNGPAGDRTGDLLFSIPQTLLTELRASAH